MWYRKRTLLTLEVDDRDVRSCAGQSVSGECPLLKECYGREAGTSSGHQFPNIYSSLTIAGSPSSLARCRALASGNTVTSDRSTLGIAEQQGGGCCG